LTIFQKKQAKQTLVADDYSPAITANLLGYLDKMLLFS